MTSTNLRMRCSWSSGAKDTEGTKNEQVKKKPPEDTDARTRSTVRRECTACVRYKLTLAELSRWRGSGSSDVESVHLSELTLAQ